MHSAASGRASSRAGPICPPQRTHSPYVPATIRSSARSTEAIWRDSSKPCASREASSSISTACSKESAFNGSASPARSVRDAPSNQRVALPGVPCRSLHYSCLKSRYSRGWKVSRRRSIPAPRPLPKRHNTRLCNCRRSSIFPSCSGLFFASPRCFQSCPACPLLLRQRPDRLFPQWCSRT